MGNTFRRSYLNFMIPADGSLKVVRFLGIENVIENCMKVSQLGPKASNMSKSVNISVVLGYFKNSYV